MSQKSEDIQYKLVMGIFKAIAKLPLPLLYPFSDLAYTVLYRLIGYRKKVVRRNLSLAFPNASEEQLTTIEKKFYRHLCDTFIETLKLAGMSQKELERRVTVVNPEVVDNAIFSGRSVIFLLGHFGNWEWMQAIKRHFKSQPHCQQVYAPLHNPVMERVMLNIRSRFGSESIPMQRIVRHLFATEREGLRTATAFISDQRPVRPLHHWTTFMGVNTPYMCGGETIGKKINAEYVYVEITKEKRGHYRIEFKPVVPPADDSGENPYTRQFMRMLEESIRNHPELWLWSHNRWKYTEPVD